MAKRRLDGTAAPPTGASSGPGGAAARALASEAEDVADTIVTLVTRPRRVAANELLVRPTERKR